MSQKIGKSKNDYLDFIKSCSDKTNQKYREQIKKGSECNQEYKRTHGVDAAKESSNILFRAILEDENMDRILELEKKELEKKAPVKNAPVKKAPVKNEPVKNEPIKKNSEWIEFVKRCQREKGISYKDAMKICKDDYHLSKRLSNRPLPQIPVPPQTSERPAKKEPIKKKSEWIEFVKRCQREKGISYKDAMKICKDDYRLSKRSELSKRPLPPIPVPQIIVTPPTFVRPAKKRIDKYRKEHKETIESETPPWLDKPWIDGSGISPSQVYHTKHKKQLQDMDKMQKLRVSDWYSDTIQPKRPPLDWIKVVRQHEEYDKEIEDESYKAEKIEQDNVYDDDDEDEDDDDDEDDEIIGNSFHDEEEIYHDYPEIQFSDRLRGNSYPEIQDVDILSKSMKRNYYGFRNQPLKLKNPYSGGCSSSGCSGNGALNTAVVIEGLEKTGLFQASKDVLKSLTRKFDEWLSNPSATRQHRIISRLIPDMTYKYNKLKNELEVFGEKWKPFRIDKHKIKMLNIEDKISSLLMELEVL